MIKFRCGHCNQKLGVPDEWGGKRIRCNHCKESCLVPHPQIELQTAPTPAQAPVSPELQRPDDGNEGVGMTSDLLDLSTGQPPQDRAEPDAVGRPPESVVPKTVRSGRASGQDRGVMAGVLDGTKRILLAIGMGLTFTLIAGALWTGITAVTQFEWFFLVVAVGWAAGFGMKINLDRPGVLTGIVAAAIGLFGMMSAKVMRAQFLYLPIARSSVEKEIAYWARLENGLSDDELDRIVSQANSPKSPFGDPEGADIFRMVLSGELSEFIQTMRRENMIVFISCRHYLETKGDVPAEQSCPVLDNSSPAEDPNLRRMNVMIADKVQGVIKSSKDSELRQILIDHLPAGSRQISDRLRTVHIGISRVIRYAFCCSDLLWIPLGIVAAFHTASRQMWE
jgi:hypothetical protein